MPPVDLETLVSACAGVSCDNKIACETLSTTTTTTDNHPPPHPLDDETDEPELPPDFPPDSFWLSKDAEFDWFDRNAFIERKDSTKGNSHSANLNPNINNQSSNSSQRFSNLKSKASILGLPKPQKTCFVEARRHCKPGGKNSTTRLFPTKRSGSNAKSDSSMIEPSSPKVSCMGRVRSKKDRHRRLKNRKPRSARSTEIESKTEKQQPERQRRGGFFATFRAIFRATSKHGKDSSQRGKRSTGTVTTTTTDIRCRLPVTDRDAPPRKSVESDGYESAASAAPIGLGGMNKFASGRRSESWIDVA